METRKLIATLVALLYTVLVWSCYCCQLASASSGGRDEMKKAGIIPDLIKSVPKDILPVTFPGRVAVEFGNELGYSAIQKEPTLQVPENPGKIYLVVMLDPDYPAPDNPSFRSKLHWLIGNIESEKSRSTFVKYEPPQSRKNGKHRFVFLMYEQPKKIDFTLTQDWVVFNVTKFATDYKLVGPVAGNFFLAEK